MTKCELKYTMPKSVKALDESINDAIESAGTVKEKIQRACVGIVHHVQKHGDYERANTLIEGLPDGVRKDALVKYFKAFAMLKSGKPKGSDTTRFTGFIDGMKHDQVAEAIRERFSEAKTTWWADMVPKSNPHEDYDFKRDFMKVAKNYAKKKQRKRELEETNPELAAKIDLDLDGQTMQQFLNMTGLDFTQFVEESEKAGDQGIPEVQ